MVSLKCRCMHTEDTALHILGLWLGPQQWHRVCVPCWTRWNGLGLMTSAGFLYLGHTHIYRSLSWDATLTSITRFVYSRPDRRPSFGGNGLEV
ncbi:unnamed protein product [Macrosiphum euphorbiae]|uniref:Uncharacterized protein n=1 Tax=Macrosiphum euphorbiae TaxID=13131 RepID=A0AAV0XG02_9HEMI|nr:unnamed protein product [Macrosiphum euphorbiae]